MKFSIFGSNHNLETELERAAEAAFSVLGASEGEVELAFVSKARIRELNRQYRNIDAVTDVLSFILCDTPLAGQIFICYTKAGEQAKEAGLTIGQEVTKLLIHGICHLYGYDHENDTDYIEMSEKEQLIWEKVS